MERRIVFVNQATGYLTIDIINEFVGKFDKVAVIFGDLRVQDIELDSSVRRSKIVEKSRESNLKRSIRWIIASFQIFFLLITKYRKYEIFYFSVPPFAYFSSVILRRRFSILMWDVYPDSLKSAGVKETNIIYKIWTAINERLFRRAYRLYTIGNSLANLLSKYVPEEKVKIIPLWSGLRNAGVVEQENNPFIIEQNLQGKFIVEYSGNIGGTHNVEDIVEAARITAFDNDILFLFIGRGTKMLQLNVLTEKYSLTNIKVIPFQPDNVIKYSLACADLSLVLVDEKAANVLVPSKIYNLLAVGSPILAVAPKTSEVSRLISHYNVGKCFCENDSKAIADFIFEMKNSPEALRVYRDNSLRASGEFTILNARKFYETYISTSV